MPFTLSHQNPTCQVTSTHYSLKEGESHIQKTRTHFKTGQAILWEDFFPVTEHRGNMCYQRSSAEVAKVRQNKPLSTLGLISYSLYMGSLSNLTLHP